MKNFNPQRHFVTIDDFVKKFPSTIHNGDTSTFRIPATWTVYAGIKLSADSSKASSALVVARASQRSRLPEDLFVVDEYKTYDSDFYKLFAWLDRTLKRTCEDPAKTTIWLHPDSREFEPTINQKLAYPVALFDGDESAGIAEANWYMLPTEKAHPFASPVLMEEASHMYWLVHPGQLAAADIDRPHGFYHARQEMATWGYDDKGNPTKVGDVLDCLRMITHQFRTYSEPLTIQEEKQAIIDHIVPTNGDGQVHIVDHRTQQRLEAAKLIAEDAMLQKYGESIYSEETEPVDEWWRD